MQINNSFVTLILSPLEGCVSYSVNSGKKDTRPLRATLSSRDLAELCKFFSCLIRRKTQAIWLKAAQENSLSEQSHGTGLSPAHAHGAGTGPRARIRLFD
jgi:hypothetical protein